MPIAKLSITNQNLLPVWLVGDVEHADFTEAMSLLRATANIGPGLPELIVLVQSRPGVIGPRAIDGLRRSAPLAGIVSLVGSWCEGEMRTGRPAAGVLRLYWYEFPSWWQRQLALRAAGRCPDWAREEKFGLRIADCRLKGGRIAVATDQWDTATAVSDVLSSANCDSLWVRPGRSQIELSGMTAGIWEGGQLGDSELEQLTAICSQLAKQNSPVVALLDFPRRDRCDAARRAGAAAVLGKPWLNADLLATLRVVSDTSASSCAA